VIFFMDFIIINIDILILIHLAQIKIG